MVLVILGTWIVKILLSWSFTICSQSVIIWDKQKRIKNHLKERKLIIRLHNIMQFPEPTKISSVQHLQKFYGEV